jgi:hypothetical protein
MSKRNVFQNASKSPERSRVPALKAERPEVFAEPLVFHSTRVPESLNRAVKRLALDERSSVQDLTAEALRLLLKNRGITINNL